MFFPNYGNGIYDLFAPTKNPPTLLNDLWGQENICVSSKKNHIGHKNQETDQTSRDSTVKKDFKIKKISILYKNLTQLYLLEVIRFSYKSQKLPFK